MASVFVRVRFFFPVLYNIIRTFQNSDLIAALGLHDLDADATLLLILYVQSALSEWAYHAFPTYHKHHPLLPLNYPHENIYSIVKRATH